MKTLLVLAVSAGVAFQGQSEQRWTEQARIDALRRAIIWAPPAVPIESADLSHTPGELGDEVRCRVRVDELNGTTPKFECELPDGEVVKVKYSGAEPYGEVAASRLLRALGFGADTVFFAKRVRCYGCPWFPYPTIKVITLIGAEKLFARGLDYDRAVDFEWAAIERKFAGEVIATPTVRGWAFYELAKVPTASRVHADALTLMAVFLAHWDNKTQNQRLVCLSGEPGPDGRCARPFAMLQDVGATFGPRKTDLSAWRQAPIWKDRPSCTVSMKTMPHGGATFVDTKISEQGRRFLADRLTRLSDAQIDALFRGARVDQHDGTIPEWTALFKARVQAIASGPVCPS
jgi:hypothetical protein